MKKILFLFLFLIVVGVGTSVVYYEGTLPVSTVDTSPVGFVVKRGDSVNEIINNLAIDRLIRNRIVAYIVIKQKGIDRNIQAGSFRLNRSMNIFDITSALTRATDDTWVTIREGIRKEEVADILTKDLPSFVPSEFINKADEGYLFPDTYLVPKSADADYMIKLLTRTLQAKLTDDIKKAAIKNKLSEKELITFASLIEREAVGAEDRKMIASILLRRMREPMRLQVDASVQYALGYQKDQKSWWKKPLYFEDLKVDSPYNTYTNDGLPKGPVANPGIASIRAAAEADPNTEYLFYLHDKNGKPHYSKTYEEHMQYIEKYLSK
jgi:UPF0755 protein